MIFINFLGQCALVNDYNLLEDSIRYTSLRNCIAVHKSVFKNIHYEERPFQHRIK